MSFVVLPNLIKRMQHNQVYIVGAARTPVGSFRSSLSDKTAPELGSIAIKGALEKSKVNPEQIEAIYMGNVLSAGIGQAPARQAALGAGLPTSVICTTVNKVCASGLKAICIAASDILLGQSEIVIGGGMESMSNAPFYVSGGFRKGIAMGNQTLYDSVIYDGLWDPKYQCHMGEVTERSASKHNISRDEQDSFAIQSYKRSEAATKAGQFKNEIIPVSIVNKKTTVVVDEDEEFKRIDFERMSSLKPAFRSESGTITAANASTINDGASAVVLCSSAALEENKLSPLARIIAFADAECDPVDFPTAPALAIPKVLKKANLDIKDIDLFEINEAFSAVVIANMKILNIPHEKVNIAGGAVSLGHPIGSSGCRILVTLVNLLKKGQKGLAAICNGGGGASAMIIEKL
jgi:acetyl-CoA C-acetyltransferase